jgi:carboxyl-terminal processing protease
MLRTTIFAFLSLLLTVAPLAAREQGAQDAKVFDEAAEIVRTQFYDPNLKGKDWKQLTDRHRQAYLEAKSTEERSQAINALLAELDASHMIHATPEEPAYYQLVDIFSRGLRREISARFPDGLSYPGIGIFTRKIDDRIFITGVMEGSPASKSDLKAGDEIVAVDGARFAPVGSFRDAVGKTVKVSIRRERDGAVSDVPVEPKLLKPGETFQTALRDSARIIEKDGKRVGYIHVWSYAGRTYQDILVDVLSDGKLKDADALIWDLRDGWGGASPEYLDLFNARGPDLKFTDRDGKAGFAGFKWRKPVAALINEGTRSGKEVLSYGFKNYKFGPLVGTRTAGALLAGRGFMLSDGTFLMVAVNDVSVDGERLEATGVEPTVEVPFDIRYSGGKDPQLEKALELLTSGDSSSQ